jgi:hypothetical protein
MPLLKTSRTSYPLPRMAMRRCSIFPENARPRLRQNFADGELSRLRLWACASPACSQLNTARSFRTALAISFAGVLPKPNTNPCCGDFPMYEEDKGTSQRLV